MPDIAWGISVEKVQLIQKKAIAQRLEVLEQEPGVIAVSSHKARYATQSGLEVVHAQQGSQLLRVARKGWW